MKSQANGGIHEKKPADRRQSAEELVPQLESLCLFLLQERESLPGLCPPNASLATTVHAPVGAESGSREWQEKIRQLTVLVG